MIFSVQKEKASGTVNPIFSVSSGYLQPSIPQETPHHLSNPMLTGLAPHSKCPAQIRNEILVSPPRAFWGSKNIPAGITRRRQKRPCTPPEATGGELPHLSLERQPAQPARSTPAEHSAECDIWLQVYQWLKN